MYLSNIENLLNNIKLITGLDMAKKNNDSEFQKLVLEQLKELTENAKNTNQSVQSIKTDLKKEIDNNKIELKKEIEKTNQKVDKLDKKIDNTKIELKKEIDNTKIELKKEIDNNKVELKKEIDNNKVELKKEINKTNQKVDKLDQKVDHGNAAIHARIDSYHLNPDLPPPPPPVEKLYKLMKIILVHIGPSWNEHKLELLIKQIYQDFGHFKKNKIGYVQFRVVPSKMEFVKKYLEAIEFRKDYQYFIDNEIDKSKHV
ncbi:unnamed protein product [Mycoplasma amphoriforme A39]|uniref:Uncharacterized protein n=2 Tax=Mycoplasma TaxID=2093 RepID=A0A292IIR5_9MOLU|nr:unnamed protein product [Mycoplasma amphoriforme A39]